MTNFASTLISFESMLTKHQTSDWTALCLWFNALTGVTTILVLDHSMFAIHATVDSATLMLWFIVTLTHWTSFAISLVTIITMHTTTDLFAL